MIPRFKLRFESDCEWRRAVRAFLLILWTWPMAFAGAEDHFELSPAASAQISTLVHDEMKQRRIPGLAVAVVQNGRMSLMQTVGFADLENEVPVTRRTVFRFASVSKPITAVATLQLAEAGQLSLDATLSTLGMDVPEHLARITVRQLLSHQSGLRHYQPRVGREPLRHFTKLDEAFLAHAADPLLYEPGAHFGYTTYGYLVLGCALECVEGKSFLDQLRSRVFLPAGMTNARADHLYEIIPHRAQGYFRSLNGQWRNSEPFDVSDKIPGGGLAGTIEDLASFVAALQDGRLLTARTLEIMWTPQKLADGTITQYALGWHVGDKSGRREVYHSGTQPRTSSFLYLRPAERLAVAVLSNLEQVDFLPCARRIADLSVMQ